MEDTRPTAVLDSSDAASSEIRYADDPIFKEVTQLYMPPVLEKVAQRALEIARADSRKSMIGVDVFAAYEEFFGKRMQIKESRLFNWADRNFTGFMIVTTLLTAYFGYMGYGQGGVQGYLEVAKIFAGAVVGGAAGAAASRRP